MTLLNRKLRKKVLRLTEQKNNAYAERNQVLAAFASLCFSWGIVVGLGFDQGEEPGFQTVLYIDLPSGQVSWHIPDKDLFLFKGLSSYTKSYDGHSTTEKYARLRAMLNN